MIFLLLHANKLFKLTASKSSVIKWQLQEGIEHNHLKKHKRRKQIQQFY